MADDMSHLVSQEERYMIRRGDDGRDPLIIRLLDTLDEKDAEILLLREGIEELSEKAWRYDQLAR